MAGGPERKAGFLSRYKGVWAQGASTMSAVIWLLRLFATRISSETDCERRGGLPSMPEPPLRRGIWSILASLWLAIVLALFLEIRVLNSATVSHLLRKLVAH